MIGLAIIAFVMAYVLVVSMLAWAWRWWERRRTREMIEAQADVRAFTAYRRGLDRLAGREDR